MCECYTRDTIKCPTASGGCRCDCHKTLRGQINQLTRATFNAAYADAAGFAGSVRALAVEFFKTKRPEDEATRAVRFAIRALDDGNWIPLLHPGIE